MQINLAKVWRSAFIVVTIVLATIIAFIFHVGGALVPLMLLVAAAGFYLAPTIVAYSVKHHNAAPIFILNLLLGWTVLGWIAALIWSLIRPAPSGAPRGPADASGTP